MAHVEKANFEEVDLGTRKWYLSAKIAGGTELVWNLGLARAIVNEAKSQSIYFRTALIDTAMAEQKDGKYCIVITQNHHKFNGLRDGRSATLAGLIVHEAAHIAWSPPLLTDLTGSLPVNKLSMHIANITEDFFIEDMLLTKYEHIWFMVYSAWNYYFSTLPDVENKLPTNKRELAEVLSYFIALKNRNSFDPITEGPLGSLWEIIERVFGQTDLTERIKLNEEFYNLLLSEYENSDEEPEEDESSEDGEAIFDLFEDADKEAQPGNMSPDNEARKSRSTSVPHIVDFIDNTSVTIVRASNHFERDSEGVMPEQDSRWNEVFKLADRISFEAPYATMRQDHGSMFGDISRISTDGKIFDERIGNLKTYSYSVQEGSREFILLVDCSGSMNYYMDEILREGPKRISMAWRAAHSASIALTRANHRVAVYGHTADIGIMGLEVSTLVMIAKDFNQPTSVIEAEYPYLLSAMRSNRDGVAINGVVQQFSRHALNKTLLVISDGDPAAMGYYDGVKHTKDMVNSARKQGVEVYSLSITREAIYANDEIYGVKNNFFNENPNAIASLVQRLM